MATRAARRAPQVLESVDLPWDETPQYVDAEGYEVDAETFALALTQNEGNEAVAVDHVVEAEEDAADGNLEDDDNAEIIFDDNEETAEDEPDDAMDADEGDRDLETKEPLLSLSDSNVLNYSLMATRQHHLKHLLPHVFTHPAIPGNLRLRARPPPKGTFLWPTPPPPVHPLPQREYHGPSQPTAPEASGSPAPSSPGANAATPGAEQPNGAGVPEQKRRKYARNKGKDKLDGADVPAHEIECLARVTLSIGPISYPGTELWVGRFVQPRAVAPKLPKVKRDKAERKRPSAADSGGGGPKRARAQVPVTGRPAQYPHAPQYAVAGPSGFRPPPSRPPGPPFLGSGGPPRPPPQPRAELSPDLIRRVNEAATKHPWLSQIIHKAARTQATKEELAKLGRVVNRLKEGKDVGEGPDDPPIANSTAALATQPVLSSSNGGPTIAPAGSSGQSQDRPPPPHAIATATPVLRPPQESALDRQASDSLIVPKGDPSLSSPASNASEPLTPLPAEDDSDSDSDVDMTGPRQVGGGPGGEDPALSADALAAPAGLVQPAAAESSAAAASIASSGHSPLPPTPFHRHPSMDSSSFAAPSYQLPQTPTIKSHQESRPPDIHTQSSGPVPIIPSQATASPQATLPPPPPPRPTYPLPPPFLLIAFKEALTEKYLLPLGSLSYISRLGEKEEIPESKVATPPVALPSPSTPVEEVAPPIGPAAPVKSRTRASLGRGLKPATPTPPSIKEEEPIEAVLPEEKRREAPRSGLQPVPGMEPGEGTVLLSTFLPAGEWRKPDWKALATSLPFNNPLFEKRQDSQAPNVVKSEPDATATAEDNRPPRSSTAPKRAELQDVSDTSELLPVRGKLLNLAAESFLPETSEVHAVTIRLNDVSDQIWQRIKTISGMVATAEMKSLGEHEPSLMQKANVESDAIVPPASVSSPTLTQPLNLAPSMRQPFQPSDQLREAYMTRKRNLFRHLLERVPSRKFLRFRLTSPRPDIVDATVDRWAPRPYPISTKALYTREEDDDAEDAVIPLSPELQPKKGSKKGPVPTVTFEMPVSLDQLDERVAENAMKGHKGHGLDGRKRHGKRWIPGTICEGCGEANKRVWRAGPGGKGTLCNTCADKWKLGTLGPLAAPGAASKGRDEDDKADQPNTAAGHPPKDASPPANANATHTDSNQTASAATIPDMAQPGPTASTTTIAPAPPPVNDQADGPASETHPIESVDTNAGSPPASTSAKSELAPRTSPRKEPEMTVDPALSLQIDGKEIDPMAPSQPHNTTSPADHPQRHAAVDADGDEPMPADGPQA